MDELRPTPGSEWRKEREHGIPFQFSTGRIAYLRSIQADLYIRVGRIPDFLTPMVIELAEKGTATIPPIKTMDETRDFVRFLDGLTEVAFVSPRIVANPQAEDECSIDDVKFSEKLELLAFFGRPVQELSSFRPQQEKPVGTVDGEPGDQPRAEPGNGNSTLVKSAARSKG